MNAWRRLEIALVLLAIVMVVGSAGYVWLGYSLLDAVYQTVTTVMTVGFREVEPLDATGKVFTIGLIFSGVGTAFYAAGSLVEVLVEGEIKNVYGRRRMDRDISRMSDHVIVCGWGRVGRAFSRYVGDAGAAGGVVVIDRDPERLAEVPHATVEGDASDDAVLRRAGIDRARALVTTLNADADNLYVTLSGRRLRPDLFIVARVRVLDAEEKFLQAGANRVVNPQAIGGQRMAAFVLQPNVAEFLDVVMHEGVEFRLEEVVVPPGSSLHGKTLRDAHIRDTTGALILALRDDAGAFTTNPDPESVISERHVLIAIGTPDQLDALLRAAAPS